MRMKRFRRSGFGVTIALVNALMAAYLSVTTCIELIDLRGRMLCGNGVNSVYAQFNIAVFLIIAAILGWSIARKSGYGGSVARCAIVGAISAWLICKFALRWD